MDELSTPAVASLRQAQNTIIEHSLDRISAAHPWYRTLPEVPRRQIESVARLGVTMFVDSVETPSMATTPSRIFNVAPAALTGTITLEQTLALVRTVLDVVVDEAPQVVPAEDHDTVRILVLTFGRDVGFAAAEVYAHAAEARGAWDARLESVAVDAMLHDSPSDAASRAGTAGWRGTGPVVTIAARTSLDAMASSHLRHTCRQITTDSLVSVRGDSVIVILGGPPTTPGARPLKDKEQNPEQAIDKAALDVAGKLDGAAVVGPVVAGIAQAGRLTLLGPLDLAPGAAPLNRSTNAAYRLRDVLHRFQIPEAMAARLPGLAGPVLLIDDLVESRWTLTIAARLLRQAGAGTVLPFALAAAG